MSEITQEQAAWLAMELSDQADEASCDIGALVQEGGAATEEAKRRMSMLAAGAKHFAGMIKTS
ncbi:hypothetical protein [Caulobacter segnis]